MTADEKRRRLMAGPFRIEITPEEVLEDLCWPGPPPGQWLAVPAHPASIEPPLEQLEREAA